MSRQVILTGIRANNDLHIGNYFGALLTLVDMARTRADEFDVNLMLADLHSFITPINHGELQANIRQTLRNYVAAGLPLDHMNVRPFRQSYVPAHSELTWILDCFVGMGELSRMTQFKDKSGKLSEDRINVGLFNYPVLMACDVLLYGAEYVPVGEDQTQHLEFMRDIAERMNERFGDLFVVPKAVKEQHEFFSKDQGLRIKDLIDPTKKMSKSDDLARGIIFLGDNPEAAAKKIMGATTDSLGVIHFDREKQPGISNLLEILALLKGTQLPDVIAEYDGKTSYGDLKTEVAERIKSFLTDFQMRLANVDDAVLMAKLEASEETMREIANKTLLKVQQAVGLRPKLAPAQDELVTTYCHQLSELGIENQIFEHSPSRNAAKVVAELGLTLADCSPTYIMKSGTDFVSATVRGDTKIDLEKIKAALNLGELRMATEAEFTEFTNVPVGAARVYNPNARTIFDQRVFEKEHLMGGSGRFDCSIRVKAADLKKVPNSQVADIAETHVQAKPAPIGADKAPVNDSQKAQSVDEYADSLRNMGVEFKVAEHPVLKTPAETQAFLGLQMSDGLSTMIMRTGDRYFAVLRRDDCRLDFAKIKTLVGGNVRMATADEFVALTGLPVGAARVYNPGLETFLDNKLFEKEYLTGGTGSFTCSFRYKSEDLKKLPNAKIVDVLE